MKTSPNQFQLSRFLGILSLLIFMGLLSEQVQGQTMARFYSADGNFEVVLREDLVPITAGNFIALADSQHFYDGVIWHRVVDDFVIQTGDPTGTGSGGPGYTIPDEFHAQLRHYKRGILSMANSGPNTGGSQFFITMKQVLFLDSLHAVFGEVTSGMEVIDSIEVVPVDGNDRPLTPVVIDSIRVFEPVSRPDPLGQSIGILGGNFPNPFSDETFFTYGLHKAGEVEIRILDGMGRTVRVLDAGKKSRGDHQLQWDGQDENGNELGAGLYYYQLWMGRIVDVKGMVKAF